MKHIKQVLNIFFPLIMMACCYSQIAAQTNYRFGTSSGPGGAVGVGYTVAGQKATFVNSATPTVFGSTNVTVSITNQQYGNATSNPLEGMTDPLYTGAVAFGAAGNDVSNIAPGAYNRFPTLSFYGTPANNQFTINKLAAPGTGIITGNTGAFSIGILTDALTNSAGNNIHGVSDLNTDIRFADITLTFNEPVSNPVIHLGGLGGTTDKVFSGPGKRSWLGYTPVFELLDAYTITRLSGAAAFDVNTATKKAGTNSPWIGYHSTIAQCYGGKLTYGASGSFSVNAVNITTLTFRIYLRSDAGRLTDDFGITPPCDGSVTDYSFTATEYPCWSETTKVRADGFTLSVSFARVKISGNVFNDPDGGYVNNSTGTSNLIPSGIYANLIDTATGLVLKSVSVGTNGVYDLGEYNASGYKVSLSSSAATPGFAPPSFTPPAGWVSTGAFNGNPNTGNTGHINGISEPFAVTEAANIVNINFGMQQLPESDNLSVTIPQPNSGDSLVLNGSAGHPPLLAGSDAQDGIYTGASGVVRNPSGVIITSLPVNGLLYYEGNPVVAGDTISNPALLTIVFAGIGYTSVSFEYTYLDAAGFADPTPAVYHVNWSSPLPVTLISFKAYTKGDDKILLEWATASEQNNKGFEIERSPDGSHWGSIGFILSVAIDGKSNKRLDYSFADNIPLSGMNYYRLKQYDFDGYIAYSPVRTIRYNQQNAISIYPNPVKDNLSISGLEGTEQIKIYNTSGVLVYHQKAGQSDISLAHLSEGLYYLQIVGIDGNVLSYRLMKIK